MLADIPFNFASFPIFSLAMLLGLTVIAIGHVRRAKAPALTKILIVIAMLFLALAAGELTWLRPLPRKLLVMVDLSPSTRTAKYRGREFLQLRLVQLLGETPYELVTFGESQTKQ